MTDQTETNADDQGQVPWWQERDRSELRPPWDDQTVYNLALEAHSQQALAQRILETVASARPEIDRAFRTAQQLRKEAQRLQQSSMASLDPLATAGSKFREADAAFVEAHTAQNQANNSSHAANALLAQACVALSTSYEQAHHLVHGDTALNQTYEGLMAQAMQEFARMYSEQSRADNLLSQADNLGLQANEIPNTGRYRLLSEARSLKERAQQIHSQEVLKSQLIARDLALDAKNAIGDWVTNPAKPAPWDANHWQSTWGDDDWPRSMAWKDYEPLQRRRRADSSQSADPDYLGRGMFRALLRRRQKYLDQQKDEDRPSP